MNGKMNLMTMKNDVPNAQISDSYNEIQTWKIQIDGIIVTCHSTTRSVFPGCSWKLIGLIG